MFFNSFNSFVLYYYCKVGGKPVENKKCVIDKISNLINLYSMHDVWREKNPNEKHFIGETKHLKFNVD